MLRHLFQRKPKPHEMLYEAIVAAARRPHFYAEWGVPDTVDGRFDMIALHTFIVLDRLKNEKQLAQALVDHLFRDMDRSLREMGVGDLSVGKKVRKIAESFYGRIEAYRAAIAAGDDKIEDAISRNIFAGTERADAKSLTRWFQSARSSLGNQQTAALASGKAEFP